MDGGRSVLVVFKGGKIANPKHIYFTPGEKAFVRPATIIS